MKQITMDWETYIKEKESIEKTYMSVGQSTMLRAVKDLIELIRNSQSYICLPKVYGDKSWQVVEMEEIINKLMGYEKTPEESSPQGSEKP